MGRIRNASWPELPTINWLIIVVAFMFVLAPTGGAAGAEISDQGRAEVSKTATGHIRIRGRVVCLLEQDQRRVDNEKLNPHQHVWGFKVNNGKVYTVQRTQFSEAIFLDEAVRSKELILKARILADSRTIEVAVIHSVRNGVEHDLYYYCDVCSIQSLAPEICVCCQGPVRLIEKALTDKSEVVPEE
jgi:hypothetical protein